MARKKTTSKTQTKPDFDALAENNMAILTELGDNEPSTYVDVTNFINPNTGKDYIVPVDVGAITPGMGPVLSSTPEGIVEAPVQVAAPAVKDVRGLESALEIDIIFTPGTNPVLIAEYMNQINVLFGGDSKIVQLDMNLHSMKR